MNETLRYILDKYNLRVGANRNIEIPGTNRITLTEIFAELGFTSGLELGVEAGLFSEAICRANPELKNYYAVDAWTAYKGYRDHVSQEKLDGFRKITEDRLRPYNARVIKGFSMDVVKTFSDKSLDFVYIDGNHEYQQTVNDVSEWAKKVRPGGIVAGHDYILRKGNGYLMHVPYAVDGYCASYDIKPLFLLGKKNDVKLKRGGTRDDSRSWFFVKDDPAEIKKGSGHKVQY